MNTHVNFEIAKLLKEKGFDKPTRGHIHISHFHHCKNGNIPLPTIAEVVMWLYEKYGIWIHILPQDKSAIDFRVESSEYPSLALFILIIKYEKNLSMKEILNSSDPTSDLFMHYDEPTEAYLAAIEYTLKNLIQDENTQL